MDEKLKKNLTEEVVWVRALFMLVFYLAFNISELLIGCIALIQLGLTLFTTKPNENLLRLGDSLSTYVGQIGQFLTFNEEEKPYPFSPWPEGKAKTTKKVAKKK